MKALNEAEEDPNVTMTPMIDVVFNLLIFFLVGTTLFSSEKDISVNLPSATQGEVRLPERKYMVINVREGGLLVLDGQVVTDAQLTEALEAAAKRDPKAPIIIRGDRKVYHEDIVRILNTCIVLDLPNVSIAVYATEEAPPKPPEAPKAEPPKKK